MKKQELEELRRLEDGLMAADDAEADIDEIGLLEETWQEMTDIPQKAYNNDGWGTDPESYSEALLTQSPRRSALPILLLLLLCGVIAFCVLKLLGVI